jgi:hypothetical protein
MLQTVCYSVLKYEVLLHWAFENEQICVHVGFGQIFFIMQRITVHEPQEKCRSTSVHQLLQVLGHWYKRIRNTLLSGHTG